MSSLLKSRTLFILLCGMLLGAIFLGLTSYSMLATSTNEFCMSCHEMRIVAEQGWMKSKHYENEYGVVANCSDCHLPPELVNYVTYKIRDGLTDLYVHNFGESDPYKMDWEELRNEARKHHKDSTCLRCHQNMTPEGLSIKGLVAHREYLRGETSKNCIQCHDEEIHPAFKEYLFGRSLAQTEGDKP